MSNFSVIFDWDGVIIDSKDLHRKSWHRCAKELGFDFTDAHFDKIFGLKNIIVIPDFLGWTTDPGKIKEISDFKEELYRELLYNAGRILIPGVEALIIELEERDIRMAIGSSTDLINIETVLNTLPIKHAFSKIVSAEDVFKGKPDPEVFLTAAAGLSAKPDQCVVLEDSPAGIEAAKRAGMKSVGVGTTHPVELLNQADMIVCSIESLQLKEIEKLFS